MYLTARLKTDNPTTYLPRNYKNKLINVTVNGSKIINIIIPDKFTLTYIGIVDHKERKREMVQDGYLGIYFSDFVIEATERDNLKRGDVLIIDNDIQIVVVDELNTR